MVPERQLETTRREEPGVGARPQPHGELATFLVRWALTVGLAIFVVGRFAAAAQGGYQLDQLQQQLGVAQAEQATLQGSVAQLTSAGRLATLAPGLHLSPVQSALTVSVSAASTAGTGNVASAQSRAHGVVAALGALIKSIANEVARM